jgi:hypothetical protein
VLTHRTQRAVLLACTAAKSMGWMSVKQPIFLQSGRENQLRQFKGVSKMPAYAFDEVIRDSRGSDVNVRRPFAMNVSGRWGHSEPRSLPIATPFLEGTDLLVRQIKIC